ncbi:MAG: beta-lactamase family protein [Ignavibacteria bacterium]|nr:beta-lactamase family protein [Ignavibacteria bacterium]
MRAFLITLFIVSSLSAQAPPTFIDTNRTQKVKETFAVVDRIYKEYAEQRHMPGLVYGVVVDDQLVYSGNFGFTNVQKKIPANSQSLFRIASMSKSVTAVAILQLRDAGKLQLDDPVSKFILEMNSLRYLTTDAPAITIRHLLIHATGLPEDNPWGDRQLDNTDAELLQLIANGVSFSNVPEIAFEYSNLGFALLGRIVAVASGKSFDVYTRENIFMPLGMNNTIWEFSEGPAERLALGYDWIDDASVDVPLLHHGSYGSMGGLITSIEDFTTYVAMHMSAWPPRNDADHGPLKRSSLREMHQPWRFDRVLPRFKYPSGRDCPSATAYGYGLRWMEDCRGRVNIGHSGGLPGFGSNWTMFPEYGIAVMSFDNITYGGTSTINLAVLDTIITLAGLEPRKLPASDILKRRQQELANILPDWENAEQSGLFAENFFLDFRISDLKKRTKEIFETAGKIVGMKMIVPENQLRGTFVIEGEKMDIEVYFTLTPEKNPLIQFARVRSVRKEEMK